MQGDQRCKAKQSKTKQSKAKQSKTKQEAHGEQGCGPPKERKYPKRLREEYLPALKEKQPLKETNSLRGNSKRQILQVPYEVVIVNAETNKRMPAVCIGSLLYD